MQLPFFQQLIDWLSTQPELKEAIDLEYIGVSGHSRGAKLAALHFASGEHPVYFLPHVQQQRLSALSCSSLCAVAHKHNEHWSVLPVL